MGNLSRDDIVSQGLRRGGNTDITTQAIEHLDNMLRSLYTGFDWPFLKRRKEDVSLVSGATSLSFGAGSGGVTAEISKIYDPIYIRTTDYTIQRRVARFMEFLEGGDTWGLQNAAGVPNLFKGEVDLTTQGKWVLRPDRIPDRNLLLLLNYMEIPVTLSGGDKPIYPNDQTLVLGVVAFVRDYDDREDKDGALAKYEAAAGMDRVKYGQSMGMNQRIGLDPNTFK